MYGWSLVSFMFTYEELLIIVMFPAGTYYTAVKIRTRTLN